MHRLLALLDANRGRGFSARVVPGARPLGYDPDGDGDADKPGAPDVDASEATVYLYDAIGSWYGADTLEFVQQIAGLDVDTIHLRINSPGGDVFDARAIKTALEQHRARVVAHVDGLAASAASFLMLAADEIEICEGGFVMIHNAWTLAMGDAREMRKTADLLDAVTGASVRDYVARTGIPSAEIQAMLDAETWLDADTALARGFVDRIARKSERASALARFDLSAYAHAPAALVAPPVAAEADLAAADLAAARARQERLFRLYGRVPA